MQIFSAQVFIRADSRWSEHLTNSSRSGSRNLEENKQKKVSFYIKWKHFVFIEIIQGFLFLTEKSNNEADLS